MSNEQRAAEMRNPDSAVDYNSQESLAAMQDTLAMLTLSWQSSLLKVRKSPVLTWPWAVTICLMVLLTVTVGDGNTTDTLHMVSNPKGQPDRRRSCPGCASGQLPKGTAEGTGASENVTGDAGNATMVDGDATAKGN